MTSPFGRFGAALSRVPFSRFSFATRRVQERGGGAGDSGVAKQATGNVGNGAQFTNIMGDQRRQLSTNPRMADTYQVSPQFSEFAEAETFSPPDREIQRPFGGLAQSAMAGREGFKLSAPPQGALPRQSALNDPRAMAAMGELPNRLDMSGLTAPDSEYEQWQSIANAPRPQIFPERRDAYGIARREVAAKPRGFLDVLKDIGKGALFAMLQGGSPIGGAIAQGGWRTFDIDQRAQQIAGEDEVAMENAQRQFQGDQYYDRQLQARSELALDRAKSESAQRYQQAQAEMAARRQRLEEMKAAGATPQQLRQFQLEDRKLQQQMRSDAARFIRSGGTLPAEQMQQLGIEDWEMKGRPELRQIIGDDGNVYVSDLNARTMQPIGKVFRRAPQGRGGGGGASDLTASYTPEQIVENQLDQERAAVATQIEAEERERLRNEYLDDERLENVDPATGEPQLWNPGSAAELEEFLNSPEAQARLRSRIEAAKSRWDTQQRPARKEELRKQLSEGGMAGVKAKKGGRLPRFTLGDE